MEHTIYKRKLRQLCLFGLRKKKSKGRSECYFNWGYKKMEPDISWRGKMVGKGMGISCNMGNPSWIEGKKQIAARSSNTGAGCAKKLWTLFTGIQNLVVLSTQAVSSSKGLYQMTASGAFQPPFFCASINAVHFRYSVVFIQLLNKSWTFQCVFRDYWLCSPLLAQMRTGKAVKERIHWTEKSCTFLWVCAFYTFDL